MKLRLRLPRQEATVPKGLEIRPVYLEEWIEGLPYAQTLNVIEQLYERLRQLNRAPLKPSLRADLLEKFLPAMAFLREAQVRQASTHSLATFDRARVDTDGARQVANQLAFGYKLVLAQSLSRHTFLGGGKYVRLGAQRACQWLSLVLVHAYHEYLPTVPHVWAELGELYRYTRSEDLDRRPSQGLQPGDPFSDSVERAFKRITLLSLVDPLRLGHGDVWAVHDWLREPADQMELVAVSGELPSESSWIIDTAADRGPVMAEAFVPTADASAFAFTPEAPSAALEAIAAQANSPSEARLASRCAELLLSRRTRSSDRVATQGAINVANGFSAVYHFLTNPSATSATAKADAEVVDEMDVGAGFDIDIGASEEAKEVPVLQATYRTAPWQVVNSSSGGYSLKRTTTDTIPLLVGELIGLQDAPGDPWQMGIVRWLTIAESDDFRIGVEVLSRQAQPVQVSAPQASDGEPLPGVLLPGRTGAGSVCLMTMSDVTFEAQEIVFAKTKRGTLRLRLNRTLESTPSMELHACEAV